jgi:AcrR family transcriptional regulator
MARVIAEKVLQTKSGILDAAMHVLHKQGYSGLSTRNIASAANVPLSQIQYHFGSKDGMVLALYEYMNNQLLERQKMMFADPNLSFSEKWGLACDFFDSDIESGYVRVLQELMAAGWSSPEIGEAISAGMMDWFDLLTEQAEKLLKIHGIGHIFSAQELAALVGSAFIGSESCLMLGLEDRGVPIRQALRRFGELLGSIETLNSHGG